MYKINILYIDYINNNYFILFEVIQIFVVIKLIKKTYQLHMQKDCGNAWESNPAHKMKFETPVLKTVESTSYSIIPIIIFMPFK